MDYVLKILRKTLKEEKYFGRSAVVTYKGGKVAEANAQFVKERIPQLELAIQVLTTLKNTRHQKSHKEYFISDNQLNLFK